MVCPLLKLYIAIQENTFKVGLSAEQITTLDLTSGTNTGDQDGSETIIQALNTKGNDKDHIKIITEFNKKFKVLNSKNKLMINGSFSDYFIEKYHDLLF